jgi:predicted O-linked N-acetylglucosamine transferase (SPINDLY family)
MTDPPPSFFDRLQSALARHEAGDLDAAEAGYRALLIESPDHPDALHLLGLLMDQRDRLEEAVEWIRRAIAVAPQTGVFHFNLGNVLRRRGEHDAAKAAWRRAAVLAPDLTADAYQCVASLSAEEGRPAAEVAAWQRVASVAATGAFAELARAMVDAGDADSALAHAARLCREHPEDGRAHADLGCILMVAGRAAEAVGAFRAAAARLPDDARMLVNLAGAIAIAAPYDLTEGVAAARRAIELQPALAPAHETLSVLLRDAGVPAQAASAARQAIDLSPRSARAHDALGNALFDLGNASSAVEAFRRAVEIDPTRSHTFSNLLMASHYDERFDPHRLLAETKAWAQRYADPITDEAIRRRPHDNDRNPDRPLRIGYVSPDFCRHPVALFFAPLLEHCCREQFHVTLYSNTPRPDDVTERFRSRAAAFRDIVRASDDEVAQLVRDDRIDILVELAGHTANHRLLLMARRPAPVQVTYLGYWNTTGLKAIGYRLTDGWSDPPDGPTERWWTEQLARVDGGAWCFRPPKSRPDVTDSPATANGFVTFISTNKAVKISRATLELWRELMLRTRRARLIIVGGGDERRFREAFRDLDPSRYEFVNRLPLEQYFGIYHRADVLLDVGPHNGHTTSVDALWMGVPPLTLAGELHCSRLGASLLSAVGLGEFIATSPEDYVARAAATEDRIDHLADLRRTMRDRLLSSPLTDGRRLAGSVEAVYRDRWRAWCKS